jgi:hypothetical protein
MAGVVVKLETLPIRPVIQPEEGSLIFCPCDFRCDFIEKVFADDSRDGIKNDFTDFLFKKITASDTIVIELIKNGVAVATITDNTLGNYYDGFPNYPLYVGWQADWTAIFNAHSGGTYKVKVTTTVLGQSTVFNSRYFKLNSYDDLTANNTVKIETLQKGLIDNSEFDFTNLLEGGWPTSIRLQGTFGDMQPNLERDIYQDSSFREVQNRDVVNRTYTLTGTLVPETILNRLATKDVLGNEVFITSYDVLQEKKYQRFPVVPESFNEVRYDQQGNTHFEIQFSDRQKNIIKTNV